MTVVHSFDVFYPLILPLGKQDKKTEKSFKCHRYQVQYAKCVNKKHNDHKLPASCSNSDCSQHKPCFCKRATLSLEQTVIIETLSKDPEKETCVTGVDILDTVHLSAKIKMK